MFYLANVRAGVLLGVPTRFPFLRQSTYLLGRSFCRGSTCSRRGLHVKPRQGPGCEQNSHSARGDTRVEHRSGMWKTGGMRANVRGGRTEDERKTQHLSSSKFFSNWRSLSPCALCGNRGGCGRGCCGASGRGEFRRKLSRVRVHCVHFLLF